MLIKAFTFADAYNQMLYNVINEPEYETAPRGHKIKEILNAQIEIFDPTINLFQNNVRSVPYKYLCNELLLYFSGTRESKFFGDASAFWNNISNDDGTVNSAYGNLLFIENQYSNITQWQWAKDSLLKDKDSRQAIMHYNRPDHMRDGIKDFPCTLSSQFFIRDNQLNLTTYMRSNDIFFGVTFDFPFFMLLIQIMRIELLSKYPDLKIGTYTHFNGSLHAYERDFETLEKMLKSLFLIDYTPHIEENPILNHDIIDIVNGKEYKGSDEFIQWLYNNK